MGILLLYHCWYWLFNFFDCSILMKKSLLSRVTNLNSISFFNLEQYRTFLPLQPDTYSFPAEWTLPDSGPALGSPAMDTVIHLAYRIPIPLLPYPGRELFDRFERHEIGHHGLVGQRVDCVPEFILIINNNKNIKTTVEKPNFLFPNRLPVCSSACLDTNVLSKVRDAWSVLEH